MSEQTNTDGVYVLEIRTQREAVDWQQSVEAQRKAYAEYLDANANAPFGPNDEPPLTFEQWLTFRMELATNTLREVYDLLREYDTITQLEDEARAYDAEQNADKDEFAPDRSDTWIRVLATFEGVRLFLDAEPWETLPAPQEAHDAE
jgi:hypothetical protein